MRIVRNKERAAQRKKEVIDEILTKAQEAADMGLNSFTYHFRPGERASFPPPLINKTIEIVSEGTVRCGYRCDYGTHVKYYIE